MNEGADPETPQATAAKASTGSCRRPNAPGSTGRPIKDDTLEETRQAQRGRDREERERLRQEERQEEREAELQMVELEHRLEQERRDREAAHTEALFASFAQLAERVLRANPSDSISMDRSRVYLLFVGAFVLLESLFRSMQQQQDATRRRATRRLEARARTERRKRQRLDEDEQMELEAVQNRRREDDDRFVTELMLLIVSRAEDTPQEWRVPERSTVWYDEFLVGACTDARWRRNFRMARGTFFCIADQLRPLLEEKSTDAVPYHKRVAVCLYRLVHGADCVELSEKFGIGESTALHIFRDVCKAINKVFKQLLSFPSGGALEHVIADFGERCRLPNVCGIIDCTHVEIEQPSLDPMDYYDRKQRYSLTMQAICDAKLRFLSVNIGFPGSACDARVWRNSMFYARASTGRILREPVVDLDGHELRPYVLGDGGYPPSPWIIPPYAGGAHQLSLLQRNFNDELCGTRVKIEQAFGLLKGKFRLLRNKITMKAEFIPPVILSCCILHNLLIEYKDFDLAGELVEFAAEIESEHEENINNEPVVQVAEGGGDEIRRRLSNYLATLGP